MFIVSVFRCCVQSLSPIRHISPFHTHAIRRTLTTTGSHRKLILFEAVFSADIDQIPLYAELFPVIKEQPLDLILPTFLQA